MDSTRPKRIPDMFVVGTDTGVGKTVVCLLLMNLLADKGYAPFYLKPFQTGCRDPYDAASDAAFVYRHSAHLKGRDPADSVVYCYPFPKAPYYAARHAGAQIDLGRLWQIMEQKRRTHCPLVIEASGGLLVPVTAEALIIDVVQASGCRPLLVARAGLGTINHTLLSIEALRSRKLEPLGVLFLEGARSESDPLLVKENMEAVTRLGRIRIGPMIEKIKDFSGPSTRSYQSLEYLLSL